MRVSRTFQNLLFAIFQKFNILIPFSRKKLLNICRDMLVLENTDIFIHFLNDCHSIDEVKKYFNYDIDFTVQTLLKEKGQLSLYEYCLFKNIQNKLLGIKAKWKIDKNKAICTIYSCYLYLRYMNKNDTVLNEVMPCYYCTLYNTTFPEKLGFIASFNHERTRCIAMIDTK